MLKLAFMALVLILTYLVAEVWLTLTRFPRKH